jgi:hypothetical protein
MLKNGSRRVGCARHGDRENPVLVIQTLTVEQKDRPRANARTRTVWFERDAEKLEADLNGENHCYFLSRLLLRVTPSVGTHPEGLVGLPSRRCAVNRV